MNSRRLVSIAIIALLITSIVWAHVPDDWSRFDHRSFKVSDIGLDGSIVVRADASMQRVHMLGAAMMGAASAQWLRGRLLGRDVTLLLQSPQTRDERGDLRAFVFSNNQNIAVEVTKAGLAYADRREKTVLDGVIDPAEAEARKKKRGLWEHLKFEDMPSWRQAWVKSMARSRAK